MQPSSQRKLLKMSKEDFDKLNKNNDIIKTMLSGISSTPVKEAEIDYSAMGAF